MSASDSAVDLASAAAAIVAARRVLVTGLIGADITAVVAACALAEACRAAIDPGSPETSRVIGPLVARIGAVTATAADLRDRADLVVFWFCSSTTADPGFFPSIPASGSGDTPRLSIAVGPHPIPVEECRQRHLALPDAAAIDCARLVEALVRGIPLDEAACNPATLAAARDLAAAIAAAHTVAIVSEWSADAVGLAAWSTVSLVRTLAHLKPAFELPLGDRADAAIAVCTWRYAAAGAIEAADRRGARFLPAEADAARLIDRRDVDCVIVVGEATPAVTAAIDRIAADSLVVRLPADAAVLQPLVALIHAAAGAAA
ncbi:MAG: hypothetical protein ACR2IT_12935 [Pirellulales bacterium]